MVSYRPKSKAGAVVKTLIFVGVVAAAIALLAKLKKEQTALRQPSSWYYASRSQGTSDRELAAAIESNDYDSVRRQLGKSASSDIRGNILERLATDQRSEALRAFLDAGWDPDGKGKTGGPIAWASKMNQLKALKVLLAKGANPNLKDSDGGTPLVTCCALPGTRPEIVETLLAHGADVSLLARSRIVGGMPINRTMPSKGVARSTAPLGPNGPREFGGALSPMDAAVLGKRCDLVRLLIRHGAKFEPTRYEATMVRFAGGIDYQYNAMKADNREIVELLLNLGVNVDGFGVFFVPGEDARPVQCTPLFAATAVGNKPVVDLLLKHGADPAVKASDSRRPADFDPSIAPKER